ncbi:YcaO-like family protein [Halobacterium salinarum]|uniref:YcaO-like family protein n=1 Tax=Halobacterium salinarum TaxID=2242 RepID=UPI001F356FBD|nr:YcaO-like family protein [Halobacterium salinarum]MCF2165239.1 YcaO-like family protein [Halobacterium salinarum]MCF2167952.1 YcaO-like family protein [Halobacterium salinarum]
MTDRGGVDDGPVVAVVGAGPAVGAVESALADCAAAITDGVAGADLGVVVGVAGAAGVRGTAATARQHDTPLVTVEVGGLGGVPLADVDAGVALLSPAGPCFECLCQRVEAAAPSRADDAAADRPAVRLAGAHAGRLAVDALRGTASPGTVVEVPHAERTVAPVPGCACAPADRDTAVPRDGASLPLADALAAADPLVDDRVGIVSQVGERESFPTPYYLAHGADTSGFSDATAAQQAAGVDQDWNAAYMRAVGEALERYSAGVYRTREFEPHTPDHDAAVPPSAFVRPASGAAGDTTQWVRGEHLQTGTDALLPAPRVVFPPPNPDSGHPITTGLGLGTAGADALLSGLYEVIERDATMLAWYSTFEPLALEVPLPSDTADDDTPADAFAALARRARAESLSVTPLLCTQDVDVPVVAVAVHREAWPQFAVGSAADLNAEAAAADALAEALQNWMELRALGPEQASQESGAIGAYADRPPAAEAFIDADTTVPVDTVGPADPPTDPASELAAVLDAVADAGLDAYGARLTPRDVDAAGFEAVRVLVPAAQPLFVSEPCFGERARTVPSTLGFEPRLDRRFHPFP